MDMTTKVVVGCIMCILGVIFAAVAAVACGMFGWYAGLTLLTFAGAVILGQALVMQGTMGAALLSATFLYMFMVCSAAAADGVTAHAIAPMAMVFIGAVLLSYEQLAQQMKPEGSGNIQRSIAGG